MKVSVVLPVFNAEPYIDACIRSVLCQTFPDFELLVIDDGSTDSTVRLVKKYPDKRIRLIANKHDFIDTLNVGLRASAGEYIARIDADDRMEPERLEKQVKLMDENPDIAVCSSWMFSFGDSERPMRLYSGYIPHPLIRMLQGNIVFHPAVMLRKSFIERHGLEYKYYMYAEDFKLWSDIARLNGKFYVIPEYLTKYRISSGQVSAVKQQEQQATDSRIRAEVLEYLLTEAELPEKDNLVTLYACLCRFNQQDYLSADFVLNFFHQLLSIIVAGKKTASDC